MFGQAEQTRARVARLRTWGDGTDLDETKTGAVKRADGNTVFIEACSQTQTIWEGQPHQFNGFATRAARHEDGHTRQQGKGAVVRAFGVKTKKEGAEVVVGVHGVPFTGIVVS